MKNLVLTFIITFLSCVNLIAQSDNTSYRFFFKVDSTYVMVDDSEGNWFTLEFKANTLFRNASNMIIIDNKKLLQINVIPFSKILPNQKDPTVISEALQAYKKWELDYQQKELKTELKSGEEIYYRDNKPFLIWWYKNPSESPSNIFPSGDTIKIAYNIDTDELVDVKMLNDTYILYLNFSIYGKKNVTINIPVCEDESLEEEIEKLKDVANSLRVYGGNIDIDVLMKMKQSKEKYVLRDSLNFLELEVPDWLNVIKLNNNNVFAASFPEKDEVVNAMVIMWKYKSDTLSFIDFVNRSNLHYKDNPNYRLIEENDSSFKYFYISDNGWFYGQNVYLKGDNIYCRILFTATKDTYDYNIGRFEEIVKNIKLK